MNKSDGKIIIPHIIDIYQIHLTLNILRQIISEIESLIIFTKLKTLHTEIISLKKLNSQITLLSKQYYP